MSSARALRRRWTDFQQSLWCLPSAFVLGALVLFALTGWLDQRLMLAPEPQQMPGWVRLAVFLGGPAAAQDLLTNISGMWATIIGVSFSITLVTIQLTATKYIAQVLPLFERDKTNQAVLGSYLATVVYALLVAHTVREQPPTFVPYVSTNVAIAMAVFSVLLLIVFIANVVSLIRPQFFLEQTLRDTQAAMRRPAADGPPWHPVDASPLADAMVPAGAHRVRARSKGSLAHVAWDEFATSLRRDLAHQAGSDGRWRVTLLKAVGEEVLPGEVLAYVLADGDAQGVEAVACSLEAACEVRLRTQPYDNVDSGIDALAGLTIKGAVQGDLDVSFEGVDCLFSLLVPLAEQPPRATALHLDVEAGVVVVQRPVPDLVAKLVRELTVVSEVALAPSLPFRLVTEGISRRFVKTLVRLAGDEAWGPFRRVLRELPGWYESAFFHTSWKNGKALLANDLAELAIAVHRRAPVALTDVVRVVETIRDRLSGNEEAVDALDEAMRRIEDETNEEHEERPTQLP